MQLIWRQTVTRQSDPELLWLGVSCATFLSIATWLALRLPRPQCAFHAITGLPCVTCGATRAALQFFHGHFGAAFAYNPLAFVTYCGLILFNLYAAVVWLTGAPRLRVTDFSFEQKRLIRGAIIALLAANWAYLLIARPV